MGCCASAPQGLIPDADGDEDDYHKRFLAMGGGGRTGGGGSGGAGTILGEGQFGQVVLVQDTFLHQDAACKTLHKGVVFKDNILYTPLKPEILQGEVAILRTLKDHSFCLQLIAVYESTRNIYIVTECCSGGDMNQWVAQLPTDLHISDVRRIARELFTAVSHCDKHRILHRDIKPANVMFLHHQRDSPLRLIDFGSGCKDSSTTQTTTSSSSSLERPPRPEHETFCGSGFFIAPEVFQRKYNGLADVWSTAVTLYVLVAGYPSEELQKAFNILQKSQRDLRQLPGHHHHHHGTNDNRTTTGLPNSYFAFLQSALTYFPSDRPTAEQLLRHEFLVVPTSPTSLPEQQQEPPPEAAAVSSNVIEGSVRRHSVFLDFTKFERSLTALLAAMLSKEELATLVLVEDHEENSIDSDDDADQTHHLNVIPVSKVKSAVGKIHPIVLDTVNAKLPSHFDGFSYHTALLNEFLDVSPAKNELVDERASNRSLRGSFRGLRRRQPPPDRKRSSSIHGDRVQRMSGL